MAREYPRFLFCNPTNTKSKGPFIIHTIFPVKMYVLVFVPSMKQPFLREVAGWGDTGNAVEEHNIFLEANTWLRGQLLSGAIQFQEPI